MTELELFLDKGDGVLQPLRVIDSILSEDKFLLELIVVEDHRGD